MYEMWASFDSQREREIMSKKPISKEVASRNMIESKGHALQFAFSDY